MFKRNTSGNVAMLFGLMLPVLMVGLGGGIELSRAVEYKQRLISATDLTCRQAEVYVESLPAASLKPATYSTEIQSYADKNREEKDLTASATITATAQTSVGNVAVPSVGVRPGNVRVTASGSLDLIFKSFLNKTSIPFQLVRDCSVNTSTSTGQPTLLLSESFEGYISQLRGGWGVFGTMGQANCQDAMCQDNQGKTKSWGTTNTGVEVDQLSAIQTGDGVQYGETFAELDSDCSNRVGTTNANQTKACNQSGQTTNASITMPLTLAVGTYEVRYVYNARKNVGAYQYPNDAMICSNPSDTDGAQRDADVTKNAAGQSTVNGLDYQTRRIELWVEPQSSGYKSDDQKLTIATNPDYMKSYMADVCIWSRIWTERKYTFKVTKQQEYRISWRAAGLDDSFGGLIDYLRICRNSCP